MGDIELIDKAELKSTPSVKFYKDSYIHIVKESDNVYEDSKAECSEPYFVNINIVQEQMFVKQDNVSADKDPIKREYSDDNDELKSEDICNESVEIQFQNTEFKTERLEISGIENASDEELVIDNESKATEMYNEKNYIKVEPTEINDAKQNRKNKKSEALPHCKEPTVIIKDVMSSFNKHNTQEAFKCLTGNAQSTKNNNGTFSYGTINDDILFNEVNEMKITNTVKVPQYKNTICENSSISDSDSVRTGSVNISPTHNDAVSSSKFLICDKTFGNETALMQHIQKQPNCTYTTSDSNNSVFTCNYCTFETSVKSRLTYHTNTKHPKHTFNCGYCDFVTNVKSRLIRHINSKHTKNIVFNCSYCSFNTYFKANLEKHINTKHTKSNVFNCSYCDYKTYVKYKLNAHVNNKHTKVNVFKCSFCNYEAYNKYSLTKHVNAKHTKTKVFNCSFCKYNTCDKRCLNAHVNAKHTKVNGFTCSYCSFKSFQQFNLNEHVNAKHTKIHSFNCSLCNYKAYSERLLNTHINIKHTKVNVFICSYCNLRVYYKPTLIRHIKTKHS